MANKLPVPVNAEINRIYFNTSITEEEILALIQNNLQYFFKASSIWRDTQEYALYIATNANNPTDAIRILYLVNVNTNEYFIILDGILRNEDGSTINGALTGNEFAIWGNIDVLNHYFNNNYNTRYTWYGWNPSHNLNKVYLNYINTPTEGHINNGMNAEAFNNNATSFVWVEAPKQSLSTFLTNIANAIRTKKGTTAQINAQDFASEIESIPTSGGVNPLQALVSGRGDGAGYYLCYQYQGDNVDFLNGIDFSTTTSFSYMFANSKITRVSQLDISNAINLPGMFEYCTYLLSIPPLNTSNASNMRSMFNMCYRLQTIDITKLADSNSGFASSCYSLTKLIIRTMDTIPTFESGMLNHCYHFNGTGHSTYNPDGLKDGRIYVPDDKVAELKTKSGWSDFADIIVPLSTLEE